MLDAGSAGQHVASDYKKKQKKKYKQTWNLVLNMITVMKKPK